MDSTTCTRYIIRSKGVRPSTSSTKTDRLAIPKYIETTEHYRLKLSVGEDDHMLRCYSDLNWCGCQETRKSIRRALAGKLNGMVAVPVQRSYCTLSS
eukprot:1340170-Amphidinium_carterae.1